MGMRSNKPQPVSIMTTHNQIFAGSLTLLLLATAPFDVAASRYKPFWGAGPTQRFSNLHERTNPTSILTQVPRGGAAEELTLDEKVHSAMKKLGLSVPEEDEEEEEVVEEAVPAPPAPSNEEQDDCVDGVCPMPDQPLASTSTHEKDMDVEAAVNTIASEMNVDRSLAWAALGATSTVHDDESRSYNEGSARAMIQQELEMINEIAEDSDEVQQLVAEGYDSFLSRRALAFAERNVDDARAILAADQMDAEEEQQEMEQAQQEMEQAQQEADRQAAAKNMKHEMKTVTVDSNFDPTKVGAPPSAPSLAADTQPGGAPKPAKKSDVVFEATSATIQKLVLESPVPVILDIYADWCGPCKVLGPLLEEMAVNGGGAFRLVKVNSDNERPVSAALEVTALPSIFGMKDGKILHSFQGMPKSEGAMKNFMMGLLVPGAKFEPPVSPAEKEKYEELSTKLVKMAGAASFSFSARERLQDRVAARLDELAQESGDLVDAEGSARILRSLMSNALKDPYDPKFRSVNLTNKVIAAKVAKFQSCVSILKSVGFVASDDGQMLTLGSGKKIVNVAPLTVARDCIDKWIDKSRYDVAKAARKRKDEDERARLHADGAFDVVEEDEVDEPEEVVDPNACSLKARLEGKKKVHALDLQADDTLDAVLKALPAAISDGEEVQITCIAKRLVVKSSDKEAMAKTLRELGLMPSASIVVSVGTGAKQESSSKLSERAAEKKKKTGTHTMHSVGMYAKDDNNKSELIDGGGGTVYEHDLTDDEDEEEDADENADAESEEEEGDDESEDEDSSSDATEDEE